MEEPDRNDRQLIDKEFYGIEQEVGKFEIDLCCDPLGRNARCKEFYSERNPAQYAKLAGKRVFCNGPFLDMETVQL